MAKYEKEGANSDDEELGGLIDSNEDISQASASLAVSPTSVVSPSQNLDKELERLLLEEAKKQGLTNVDLVQHLWKHHFLYMFRVLPMAVSSCKVC